jgi:hypothetical protein
MIRHAIMSATLVVAVAVSPLAARAADMEGRVQSVDVTERTVVLDNGAKVWLSDGVAIETVTAGAEVKVSYEDKDGRPVATSVEMK